MARVLMGAVVAVGFVLGIIPCSAQVADRSDEGLSQGESGVSFPFEGEMGTFPRSPFIYPTPEPFSFSWRDARTLVSLLRRGERIVELVDGVRTTVVVEDVAVSEIEPFEALPGPHRRRWQITVNGKQPVWTDTYISYEGRLVNVQLLFTYRNQRPLPDVPYTIE